MSEFRVYRILAEAMLFALFVTYAVATGSVSHRFMAVCVEHRSYDECRRIIDDLPWNDPLANPAKP